MVEITPEEQAAFVELGLNQVDDLDMLHVAQDMADPTRLPEGWSMHLHPDSGRHFYVSTETQESTWEHPLLRFYLGHVFMERGGKAELERNAQLNPATDDEVAAMAEYLEVRPTEHPAVLEVARLACCAPYPAGWVEERDAGGEVVFRNMETGEVSAQHPLDDYFMELAKRKRLEARGMRPVFGPPTGSEPKPSASARLPPPRDASHAAQEKPPGSSNGPAAAQNPPRTGASVASVAGVGFSMMDSGPSPGSTMTLPAIGPRVPSPSVNLIRGGEAGPVRQSVQGPPRVGPHDERIRVVIRARPLERRKATPAWKIDSQNRAISFTPADTMKHAAGFYGNTEGGANGANGANKLVQGPQAPPVVPPTAYRFDSVCGPEATSYEIYHNNIKDIVRSALDGVNGTVFAYGQTGSGKTYTIVGKKSAPGLLVLAADDLFEQVTQRQANGQGDFVVRCGMIEIYNEELGDLLVPPGQKLVSGVGSLKIKDDPATGVRVAGLHEEVVTDSYKVKVLLDRGMARRVVAQTKMNDSSSRSHTIFRFQIENHYRTPGSGAQGTIRVSSLNFVDLAGSERLDKTGSEGLRAQESANINLSLFMLGNVISKLSEGRSADFVPYRNSKLTRILQPSLGGNARAAIVANISIAQEQAEETSHTLRFAARAANVKNRVTVNEMVSDEALIKRYKNEIDALQKQLAAAQNSEIVFECERLRRRIEELTEENEKLRVALERSRTFGAVAMGPGQAGGPGGDMRGPSMFGMDDLPGTPPDLSLPQVGGARSNVGAKDALVAIHRIVAMGKGGRAGGGGGANQQPNPGELVQAVRIMRAERDELRRKLMDARGALERQEESEKGSKEVLQQWHSMDEAVRILEDLVGGSKPGSQAAVRKDNRKGQAPQPQDDGSPILPQRLRDAVEACVILQAELASLQRQHGAGVAMLREEEGKGRRMAAELERYKGSGNQVNDLEREIGQLSLQAAQLQRQRDDMAAKAGVDPRTLPAPADVPGERAMRFADLVEQKLRASEERHRAELVEKAQEIDRLKAMLREYLGVVPGPGQAQGTTDAYGGLALVGSAAVRAAREAKVRARTAEERVAQLEAEAASLRERTRAAEAREKAKEDASHDRGGDRDRAAAVAAASESLDPQAMVEKLKKRVYGLSKEVAALTRERDELLQRLAGGGSSYDGVPMAAGGGVGMYLGAARRGLAEEPSAEALTGSPTRGAAFPPIMAELRARRGPTAGPSGGHNTNRRQVRSSSAAIGGERPTAARTGWIDPSATAKDSPIEEIRNLKKRVVQSEKAHRDLLQQKQMEVRAMQLRSQAVERNAMEAKAMLDQLAAENARLRSMVGG